MLLPTGNLATIKLNDNVINRAGATCLGSTTPWCGFIAIEAFAFGVATLQTTSILTTYPVRRNPRCVGWHHHLKHGGLRRRLAPTHDWVDVDDGVDAHASPPTIVSRIYASGGPPGSTSLIAAPKQSNVSKKHKVMASGPRGRNFYCANLLFLFCCCDGMICGKFICDPLTEVTVCYATTPLVVELPAGKSVTAPLARANEQPRSYPTTSATKLSRHTPPH